ncbi:MAG: Asp-tRNA(Asn)/Glu-tRNA(Gln) amidotransferase subunit GatA [Vicinamibacteria bacterium]|nr:Asp-tRNA(Asn)/Glu-tRNA(Gln) amidotransferase subunit GatA [Vicinamibacteria bacterium]
MTDLWRLNAREISEKVRKREVSAVEVMRAHLSRIEKLEPRIDAFLHVNEHALSRARSIDSAVSRGSVDLPLAGVPAAIKDVLHVANMPTTCASKILRNYVPPFTATCVARLERAGAIILGKTNMDEFAMGSSTENSGYKPTRNPWSAAHVPGGSSGGSAAAVAAQMAPIALGTDTGGSIRQPAAFCGVVGIKPTYGRVSRYGLVAFASSLDQAGPFARTVQDAAVVLAAISGRDDHDATSVERRFPDAHAETDGDARGLRVGVPWEFLKRGVDAGVMTSFREALDQLQACGALLRDVSLPHLAHAVATYYIVATAEASSNLARYDGVRYGRRAEGATDLDQMYGETRDRGFGAEVKRRIILGTFVLSSGYYDAYYLRAQKVRALIRRDFEAAFESCDVIATPTTPSPAFKIGEKTDDPLKMYLEDVFTVPANLAGLPGLSIPCGLSAGLPVGLQLMSRWFDESMLLRAGHAFERLTEHHLRRPPL